jgi:GntR family transcriptional regulator
VKRLERTGTMIEGQDASGAAAAPAESATEGLAPPGSGAGSGAASRPGQGAPRPSPLYRQVKQHLVQRVLAGEWRPGECLPSELKLAEGYGLSQGTVRKAIEEMAQEGLVSRQAGRGTFVTSHSGSYRAFRFHRLHSSEGVRVASEAVTFVGTRREAMAARAAAALELDPGAPAITCLRLRHLGQKPVLVEEIVLPERLFAGIVPLLEREKPPSIYLLLERHYNVLVTRVIERVRARAASEAEAGLLAIRAGTPVLEVERVAFSLGGEPVEWRTMVGETTHIHYENAMG